MLSRLEERQVQGGEGLHDDVIYTQQRVWVWVEDGAGFSVAAGTPAAVADELPAHGADTPVDGRRRPLNTMRSDRPAAVGSPVTTTVDSSMLQTTSKSKYLGGISTNPF